MSFIQVTQQRKKYFAKKFSAACNSSRAATLCRLAGLVMVTSLKL
jgi:hypothetical protein